ncbi:MAG: homoserine kinase, partial [Elusimicrobia bacterium]|nr:homoserine kinase [Elusimicrobiota bacterium]
KQYNKNKGFSFRFVNRIPLRHGLGSSAAARLSGLAVAHKVGGRLKDMRRPGTLVYDASRLEGHPDGVAPAFFGGLCASRMEKSAVWVKKWNMPADLKAVACVPDFDLETVKARRVLPRKVPLQDAVANLANSATLIASLTGKDYSQLGKGMQDRLHQPYRKALIPGMERVMDAALNSGALGACLSGAGPTMLAIGRKNSDLDGIGAAMSAAFKRAGVKSRFWLLNFDNRGLQMETT